MSTSKCGRYDPNILRLAIPWRRELTITIAIDKTDTQSQLFIVEFPMLCDRTTCIILLFVENIHRTLHNANPIYQPHIITSKRKIIRESRVNAM